MKFHPAVHFFFLFAAVSAHAVGSGGYTNQVGGAKASGMGNTFTAVADDLSAVFFNPAGLTQRDSFGVSAGVSPVSLSTKYTSTSGEKVETEDALPMVPYFYMGGPAGKGWMWALGLNSSFGLETHWRDDGPLRYVATDSSLHYAGINPSAAYRINDRLSVGAGLVHARVSTRLDSRLNETGLNTLLNAAFTPSPDGGKSLKGDGYGWGWNAGVLYDVGPTHRLGLSYRSAVKVKIKGDLRLTGLSNASAALFGGENYSTGAETVLDFPQILLLGYAFRSGRWTWALDGEWTGYSVVKETSLVFQEKDPTRSMILNTGNPIPREWKDSWNIGGGVDVALDERVSLRAGAYYCPAVIPERNWAPSIPENTMAALTAGAGYARGGLTWELAYNLVRFDRKTVDNDVGASSGASVDGAYETQVHIFYLGLTWKRGKGLTKK